MVGKADTVDRRGVNGADRRANPLMSLDRMESNFGADAQTQGCSTLDDAFEFRPLVSPALRHHLRDVYEVEPPETVGRAAQTAR